MYYRILFRSVGNIIVKYTQIGQKIMKSLLPHRNEYNSEMVNITFYI